MMILLQLLKAYNINCPKYSQLMEEDKNTKAYKDKMKENEVNQPLFSFSREVQ